MTKTPSITKAQITRAILGAKDAGFLSPVLEIQPGGRLLICEHPLAGSLPAVAQAGGPTPLQQWLERKKV